ncbi:MAG TPA: hypothetical protein ENG20_00105, partial [Methanomicrobia archaeon]|nr:hypothetical protein [Methanomicrobia archaeon]
MKKYLVFNAFGAFVIENNKILDKKFFKDPKNPIEEIKELYKKYPDAVFENKEIAMKFNAKHE